MPCLAITTRDASLQKAPEQRSNQSLPCIASNSSRGARTESRDTGHRTTAAR